MKSPFFNKVPVQYFALEFEAQFRISSRASWAMERDLCFT